LEGLGMSGEVILKLIK